MMAAGAVSAPSVNLLSMVNPWRLLGALTHVELIEHDDVPDAPMGETDFEANTISLRRGLSQAARRCTLLHELLHVERGPSLDEPVLEAREELRVRRRAARLLLPDVRAIGEALAWSRDHEEAAFELWVDEDTLLDRLDHLHPAERHYLRRRLEHAEVP